MLKALRRPLILCVEDEPLLLRDLCDELEEAGYQAIGVPDVAAAHLVLARLTPSLILCDINLPGQSGLDLLAELRETDALPQVPFLLLTAQADRAHMLRGKWAGADDYLVKPVDYDMLLATVASRLAQMGRMARTHQVQLQRQAQDVHYQWHSVLDALSHCALVCNPDLSLRFANRAAYQLSHASSERGPLLVDDTGALALRPSIAAHRDLQSYLLGDAESACIDVLDEGSSHVRWRVTIQALQERQANAPGEGFVVFIADLGQPPLHSAEAMAQRFALTPTETQVASLLVEGMTKQQMCAQLQVSATTMAFHLRNMFAKTKTNRQAELVAVLLSSVWSGATQPAAEKV